MEADTLYNTPVDVEAEALVDMLPKILSQVQAKTFTDTLVKRGEQGTRGNAV